MKKTITKFAMLLGITCTLNSNAQSVPVTETFESFTVDSTGYYKSIQGHSWQDAQAVYRYSWDTTYSYWSGGSAYTNLADTGHGDFNHIYNCAAKKGYNNSNMYVTAQPKAIIKLKNAYNRVNGFYVTNTTYAYMAMKNGNSFSRKFGDTTGTHSGLAQGSYPDWFKLLVHPYKGGVLTTDSVEFYLADFRFTNNTQDYIVQNWQYLDCSSLGIVDSITFDLKSSDVGSFGMNTPAFFSFDNFTTQLIVTGINELASISEFKVFPNPASDFINVQYTSKDESEVSMKIYDVLGSEVLSRPHYTSVGINQQVISTRELDPGIYFLEVSAANYIQKIKFVKQ